MRSTRRPYLLLNQLYETYFLNTTASSQTTSSTIINNLTTMYVLPTINSDTSIGYINEYSNNTEIYNMFKFLLEILTYEDLSVIFNKKVETLKKIVQCSASNLDYIQFGRQVDVPKIANNEKYSMTVILIICLALSILGNSLFIYLLMPFKSIIRRLPLIKATLPPNSHRKHQSTTLQNSHIAQQQQQKITQISDAYCILASAIDLFFSLCIIPLHIGIILHDGLWIFGKFSCKIFTFSGHLALCITSLILVTISIERYTAIVKNKQHTNNINISHQRSCLKFSCFNSGSSNKTKLQCSLIVLFIYWLISSALASPYLIYNVNLPIVVGYNCLYMTEDYMCVNIWPNTLFSDVYKVCYWVIVFIVPGFILLYSYGSISWSLFIRTTTSFKNNYNSTVRTKSKRRIIIILIFDCLFYLVCWFPFSIWSMEITVNSLKKANQYVLKSESNRFFSLYTLTLVNVSLKWIFRLIASWSRLQEKLHFIMKFFTKNKVKPKRVIIDPYIIPSPAPCGGINSHSDYKRFSTIVAASKQQQHQQQMIDSSTRHQCNPIMIFVQPTSNEYIHHDNVSNINNNREEVEEMNSFTKETAISTSIRKDSKSSVDCRQQQKCES